MFSSGLTIGQLDVGSTVKIKVNGTARDFIVVNQGIPSNSSLYDSSCNGTWLLMKDVYEKRAFHTEDTTNLYANSTIHPYLNDTFLKLFDSKVQSIIKTVKIPYVYNSSNSVNSGANGLSTKVFLLSGREVSLTKVGNHTLAVDGAALSYFSGSGNSNSNRIATYSGSAIIWWTRTRSSGTNMVNLVSKTGTAASSTAITAGFGVRPALILPSETLVDDSFNVIA